MLEKLLWRYIIIYFLGSYDIINVIVLVFGIVKYLLSNILMFIFF